MTDRPPSRRVNPETLSRWAVELREPLKLAIIVAAFLFAVWQIVTAANPVGLLPLLGWAMWQQPRNRLLERFRRGDDRDHRDS